MPVGLIVMKWDERVGTEILAKYPEEIIVTDKTLMQVYSTHEYSGESGMISLMVGSLNIASYYTGPAKGCYVLLLLNLDDDPDSYETGLIDVSRIILQNLEDGTYQSLIPSLFQRLSAYPSLNDEQRIAITYQDEIKRMIIKRLRDEGVVLKSEMMVWLKDKYKQGFVDLDGILLELIKRGLIKEASVKGMPSELIFLTHDIIMLRIPPVQLLKDPADRGLPAHLARDYRLEVKKFFQNYKPSEQDNLRVVDIMVDPQVYETIKLLRSTIVTKDDLEKLRKKGVEDMEKVLKVLSESQTIHEFQDDSHNKYYALLSDFYVEMIFPEYLLNVIKVEYEKKSKADQVLVEYLTVLENTFLESKSDAQANK